MTTRTLSSNGTKPPVVVVPTDVEGTAGEEPVLTEEELRRLPPSPMGPSWTLLNNPDAWVARLNRERLARLEHYIAGTQE